MLFTLHEEVRKDAVKIIYVLQNCIGIVTVVLWERNHNRKNVKGLIWEENRRYIRRK